MSESSEAPLVRVHATVWAIDRPHERLAVRHLIGDGWPGAARFDLRGVSVVDPGLPCPLDLEHWAVLASQVDPDWAWVWVLHDLAVPAPRTQLVFDHDDGCPCLKGERAARGLQAGSAR